MPSTVIEVPVSAILDALAGGGTPADVARHFPGANLTEAAVREAAMSAADLAGRQRLSPPAAAALSVRLRGLFATYVSSASSEVDETDPKVVANGAEDALRELAGGESTVGRFGLRAAAAHGAALAREHEMAADPDEPPSPLLQQLGSDDRRLVEEYQSYRRHLEGWRRAPWTIDGAIDRWGRFVQKVANGYDDLVDEYVNDLDVRDHIQEALDMVGPPGRQVLSAAVEPLDRRFEQATRPSGFAPWSTLWAPRRWWWRRAPVVLSAHLARYFTGGDRP